MIRAAWPADPWVKRKIIMAWLAGIIVVAAYLVMIAPALAVDNGQYANSPLRDWFKSVRSKAGVPCCDMSDGHKTESEIRGVDYWVPIGGAWLKVPPEAVICEFGNPVGEAVVWYVLYQNAPIIRCFVPGAGL